MRTNQMGVYTVEEALNGETDPGYSYGLGVGTHVSKVGGQRSAIGEFGWDGAAGAYTLMDPANKLSIFFAMNVTGWGNLFGGHGDLRNAVYESLGIK